MKTVTYIFPILHKFRAPFHEKLREILAGHDIDYQTIYCAEQAGATSRDDRTTLDWAHSVPLSRIGFGSKKLLYQHALRPLHQADLVIIQQENKLLLNYYAHFLHMIGAKKIAFFGHGRTPPYSPPQGLRDDWKRFWLKRVHWWFAYTEGVAKIITDAGFAPERITVFNNAIDTSTIRTQMKGTSSEELKALRQELGINSDHIGLYIGGMYKEKRLKFLIEAALLIRRKTPDFQLLLVGAGVDAHIAKKAAAEHAFIHYLGPKFGHEKTRLAMIAKVFLMPGLVGLAILDSFAYELPIITTNVETHSPEIDYLEDGINGIIVEPHNAPAAYAASVSALLEDENKRQTIITAGRKSADQYTLENMAERFAQGRAQSPGIIPEHKTRSCPITPHDLVDGNARRTDPGSTPEWSSASRHRRTQAGPKANQAKPDRTQN